MGALKRVRAEAAWAAGFALLALLSLSPWLGCWNCLLYPPDTPYSDLLISHLPNLEYWRAALFTHGQWPLWNAQLFAGQPFAADPLAGLWYPPNWLLVLMPAPFGFNLLFALHLAWAGWGLAGLLRDEGVGRAGAVLGGLAFAAMPKLIAHAGAGHISLVCAVAWTPWLLRAVRRGLEADAGRWAATAGGVLGLITLADPRWAFYAGGLAALGWLWPLGPRAAGWWARGLIALGVAAAVSAALWLPLLDFVARTSRSALTLSEAAVYALPPIYFLGLLIPPLRGFHEYMTYLGAAPLWLAVAAAVSGAGRRGLWLTVALGAALFALGDQTPVYGALFNALPGLSLLRVPSRAWFLVGLAAAVLAGHGLDRLLTTWLPALRASAALPRLGRFLPGPRVAGGVLVALTVIDLWRVNATLIEARPRPARVPAAEWLAAQGPPESFRVYSPSYSLPLDDGLHHVDGVNPLHLARTARLIERASGVPSRGYTESLPAFKPAVTGATADPATVNAGAVPDAALLGLLNARFVAAEFDVAAPDLQLVRTFGRTRVYENLAARPRVWAEGGQATLTVWSPNRLVVEVTLPADGLVVISEAWDPGWRATVDGKAAPVEVALEALQGVPVPAGVHVVELVYQPWPVGAGLAVSALGMGAWLWRWRRR